MQTPFYGGEEGNGKEMTPNTPQSTKKIEEIQQILGDFRDGIKNSSDTRAEVIAGGTATYRILTILKETLEEALPEKKTITKYEGKRQSLQQGWNNAIDQTKANFNNLLGGDDNDLL